MRGTYGVALTFCAGTRPRTFSEINKDSVRNNSCAVAQEFSRPWLGIATWSLRYTCAFRVPLAQRAGAVLPGTALDSLSLCREWDSNPHAPVTEQEILSL